MTKKEGSDGLGSAGHISEGQKADEDAALQARLDNLSKALAQHEHPDEPDAMNVPIITGQSLGAANLGFRVLIEFASAIVIGALIGWQIDTWAHTGPIFLVIFLLLGTAGGMLNIYRIAMGPKTPGRG